jgi:hypothetical protein
MLYASLNCIGYLVLVYALYRPRFHRFHSFTRWLLIGYTALTILLIEGRADPAVIFPRRISLEK